MVLNVPKHGKDYDRTSVVTDRHSECLTTVSSVMIVLLSLHVQIDVTSNFQVQSK